MKFSTKQMVQTALLLALCIASQFLKNTSVYITGSIVNAILVIATLAVGIPGGIIISVIAPITSFFITGSPIIAAMPLMIPVIMIGNSILVLFVGLLQKKKKSGLFIGMGAGCVVKAAFMWIMTSFVLFPIFGSALASKLPKPEMAPVVLNTAKVTFSLTQLITAIIGCVIAYIVWIPLKKYLNSEEN